MQISVEGKGLTLSEPHHCARCSHACNLAQSRKTHQMHAVHRFTRASTYHEWRESPALPCSAPVRPATISRPALTRLDQPLGRRAPATKLATPLVTNNLATRAQ